MAEHSSDSSIEGRVRDYLAVELQRAQADFRVPARGDHDSRRSSARVIVVTAALLLAIAVAIPPIASFVTSTRTESGAQSACAAAAREMVADGQVVGAFASTIDHIRQVVVVGDNPQLSGFESSSSATLCYIDGGIGKGPEPPQSGSPEPLFNRAVVVIVNQTPILIATGYRDALPIQSPAN